jgi:hypothetical protein
MQQETDIHFFGCILKAVMVRGNWGGSLAKSDGT